MSASLTNPKNRGEQIEGVIRFILDNDLYYDSLRHTPNRLNACVMNLFETKSCNGYHAHVIREALRELNQTGKIDTDALPYEMT